MKSKPDNSLPSTRRALLIKAAVLLALVAGLEFFFAWMIRGGAFSDAGQAAASEKQSNEAVTLEPAPDAQITAGASIGKPALLKPVDPKLGRPLTEQEVKQPMKPRRVRIGAAGDIMLQRRVNRSVRQKADGEQNNFGYDGLFPGLSEAFTDCDLTIANMEFSVWEKRMPERALVFHGEPPVLDAFKRAGFMMVTAANNHAYDHGRSSPASTARICREKGMVCLGVGETRAEAQAPYLVEKNGIKLAFIGYAMLYNSNQNSSKEDAPHVNGYKFEELLAQVEEAKKLSDCVVVTVHWGQEYRTTPLTWQPKQARQLFEAGACLILGHHPHVLEPIELMETKDGRRCLVIYSLGNFVSNQSGGDPAGITRLGAILKVDLVKTERGVEVEAWDTLPSWVENRDLRVESERIEDIHIQVVPLMIEKLEAELEKIEDQDAKAKINRQLEFYRGRVRQAEKILKLPRGEVDQGSEK